MDPTGPTRADPATSSPSHTDTAADRARLSGDLASPARVYDYLLGGKDNYAPDRRLAEQLLAAQGTVGTDADQPEKSHGGPRLSGC